MIDPLSEVSRKARVDPSSVNPLLNAEPAKVLVVDDHPFSRLSVVDLLKLDGYEVLEADSSSDIIQNVLLHNPDLILLDVFMPQIDGFEVCQQLKQDNRTRSIPVIFMTVADDRQSRLKSQEVGGEGFLIKPLDRLELSDKVKTSIQQKRLNESLTQTNAVLFSLASAIEERYSDDRGSSVRLEKLAQSFGEYLQLSAADISDLIFVARLHDVGTVAIPDSVLLKKGELTEEEREMLKQHVLLGEKICQPLQNRPQVSQIIRHHHERWDGTGYPDGIIGDRIPWLAQVFQILDIYDALTSQRPHKQPLTPRQALEVIVEETDKGWRNPELIGKFTAFIAATELVRADN